LWPAGVTACRLKRLVCPAAQSNAWLCFFFQSLKLFCGRRFFLREHAPLVFFSWPRIVILVCRGTLQKALGAKAKIAQMTAAGYFRIDQPIIPVFCEMFFDNIYHFHVATPFTLTPRSAGPKASAAMIGYGK